ncbi:hypothetical protein [Roseobacter ponti]|uniref:Type II methyltransferase M.Eco57I C-terminal domain-containing protein n=1 Tax=Roseobacter ponti TaxID=1891787 RepID=A0A858SND0_9RHOB|nr:hypothetical protein [Roseobacter ponti]QJF50349.1 hypothetical protein G3256_03800 [Roseobacter ponti]
MPTRLVDLRAPATPDHFRYIDAGVAQGMHQRYLTSRRKPWYSMERQEAAPVRATVFGRGKMRFVANDARVRTLTAFHCIYPLSEEKSFVHALTACLNADFIQEMSQAHQRAYAGGLHKFEPRDLLDVCVPDLRCVSPGTIRALAAILQRPDFSGGVEELGCLLLTAAREAQAGAGLSATG